MLLLSFNKPGRSKELPELLKSHQALTDIGIEEKDDFGQFPTAAPRTRTNANPHPHPHLDPNPHLRPSPSPLILTLTLTLHPSPHPHPNPTPNPHPGKLDSRAKDAIGRVLLSRPEPLLIALKCDIFNLTSTTTRLTWPPHADRSDAVMLAGVLRGNTTLTQLDFDGESLLDDDRQILG